MDCRDVREDLIAFHLGALTDERRAPFDAHLLACRACLRAYLELKRAVELDAGEEARPSEAARLRLRAAVAARFRPSLVARAGRWLRRPVPLYQGLTLALVLLALAALVPPLVRALPSRAPRASGVTVDTARQSAESLNIY
jgi:anti-sigma factor RsiW